MTAVYSVVVTCDTCPATLTLTDPLQCRNLTLAARMHGWGCAEKDECPECREVRQNPQAVLALEVA